ncbi:HD-domain/PDEase-like protein [Auriculariales sp. MPI-PUGE-AT-0066]|nr:HD-domain/PDEase-like protein [Auriculariales sp. MPI-PUGE-AT-0066]
MRLGGLQTPSLAGIASLSRLTTSHPPRTGKTMTEYSEEFAHARSGERRIKDPIHDYIPISPRLVKFIDTPQFQRLRYIKQLGAAHNRFEHSLGVMHLCGRLIDTLRTNQPRLGITEKTSLCHDLGHGPFSHVWDSHYMPRALARRSDLANRKWEHEEGSELMFDALVKNDDVDISEEEVVIVKALIRGEKDRQDVLPKRKAFMFEIVANKTNGIDVDRLDYIARDNWAVEGKADTTALRLIDNARVLGGHICFHIKDVNQVYSLFHTRFNLFKRIYLHKTSVSIEYMIVDALLAADDVLKITDRVFDAKRYTYFTDDIIMQIMESDHPGLAKSQEILGRLQRRNLYRLVDSVCLNWALTTEKTYEKDTKTFKDMVTTSKILCHAKEYSTAPDPDTAALVAELEEEHVIVDFSPVHWGMKAKNPINEVLFYNGKHAKPEPRPAGKEDITQLLPEIFAEVHLRVYTRESRFFGIIQHAFRALLSELGQPIHALSPGEVQEDLHLADGSLIIAENANAVGRSAPSTPRQMVSKLHTASPGSGVPRGSDFMTVPMNHDSHPPASPTPSQKRAISFLSPLDRQLSPSPSAKIGDVLGRGTKRLRDEAPSEQDTADAGSPRRGSGPSSSARKSARLSTTGAAGWD